MGIPQPYDDTANEHGRFLIALGEKTYHYISELKNVRETFKKYEVHLKGYDRPTTTYAATFNRLKDFLRKKLLSQENKNLAT